MRLIIGLLLCLLPSLAFSTVDVVTTANYPVTHFVSTPTVTAITLSDATNATQNVLVWREGKFIRIWGKISWSGAGGGGAFSITIPSSLVADTSVSPGGTGTLNQTQTSYRGNCMWFDNGVGWKDIYAVYASTTTVEFKQSGAAVSGTDFASGDALNLDISIPIVGWR